MIENPDRALEVVRSHRDASSVSNPGWGRWAHVDPAKTLPIIKELLPGHCRMAMLRDAASYYFAHPESLEDSEAWFAELPPEIQKLVLGLTEDSVSVRAPHTVRARLQDAWAEIRDAASTR